MVRSIPKMSTAIFIGALIIGSAINPELGPMTDEVKTFYGWMFTAFVIYDLLNMRSK